MKKVKSTVLATSAAPETVVTVHGPTVAVSELLHIAPHLRPFAIDATTLNQDPRNARKHGKDDLASTAESLKDFGFQELIQFDPETRIIKVGNGRHAAAVRLLEWKYVPAVPSNLSSQKLRAYALAHNRTAEKSEWDFEMLAAELDAIKDEAESLGEVEDVDMSKLGFSSDELQELEEDLLDKKTKKSAAVEPKSSESVSGKVFNVVIKCTNEKRQLEWEKAINDGDAKLFRKLCVGVVTALQN